MRRWITISAIGCIAASTVPGVLFAQERMYRCGNEYTNNAAVAKQPHCQEVQGGHVTVVHTNDNSGKKPVTAASSNRSVVVNRSQQNARDSDARAILQVEERKAQDKLDALKLEFNDGNPVKTALELRNPQAYMARVESLKADIARHEADVAGIQRELGRVSASGGARAD